MSDSEFIKINQNTEYKFKNIYGITFVFEEKILEIDEKISSAEIKPLGIIYEENGEYYLSPLDEIDDIKAIMKDFVESYLKWKNCFKYVKLL